MMNLSVNNWRSASINSNQFDTKIPTEKKPEYKDNTHLLNGMIASLEKEQFGFQKDFKNALQNNNQSSWQRASLKSAAHQAAIDDLSELKSLAGKTHENENINIKEHKADSKVKCNTCNRVRSADAKQSTQKVSTSPTRGPRDFGQPGPTEVRRS